MKKILFALGILLLLSACKTTVAISENLSPAEIIQRAHEAMDRNRYKIATQYYQALYERNQTNIDLIITAEYHLAFIEYKQRRFAQARAGLKKVLEYYNSPDEILLPQHFKRLSQIVLQSIDEKENRRRPSRRRN